MTLQHPLDPYFKALAKREQFFRKNPGLARAPLADEYADVIYDEQCIIKANEVYSDLRHFKE